MNIVIVQLSSVISYQLVITRGIEEKIFHRLGDLIYNTGSRTVVFGFCLSRVYSNSPLLLCPNKITDRYSLLHLCNFSIYHDVTN